MTAPYYTDGDVTLHHGDALAVAEAMPSRSVQTIVTSPPYFGLRDYGHDDQLGAEATVGEYVANLVTLFRELRRVLTDDGTLWLNLGDSYAASPKGSADTGTAALGTSGKQHQHHTTPVGLTKAIQWDVPQKNLLGVPWRVAFALQDDGWILRSDIIWAKPNPMPESVTDRPTKAHEYVFLLAKQPRYYYDAAAIAEDIAPANQAHYAKYAGLQAVSKKTNRDRHDTGGDGTQCGFAKPGSTTRNKRSLWEVATAPFPGAHFAVYPPELIRPCILAGSRPGDTVLDPFSGSGTTGMVANAESRKYVGIDVNADYLDLSLRTRFAAPALNIWDTEDAS